VLTYNDAWYNKSQTVKTYRTTYKSKDPKTKRRMHTDFSSALECMVGDVNLFFNDPHNETVAELELMIAEPGYHRRGLGLEAARLMMAFGESAVNPVFITITVAAVFGAWHGHKSFTPTTSRMLTSTLHSFVICIYHLKLCGCVCRCEKQYVGNTALVHSFVELCVYNNYY
jgi:hypothetical protein